jgi:FlaA1/EpsC-like NDP-sugar epimerase
MAPASPDYISGQPGQFFRLLQLLRWMAAWPRVARMWTACFIDAILCVSAVWAAFSLRVGQWHPFNESVWQVALFALFFWFPIALSLGVYRSLIRFSGGRTMFNLSLAIASFTLPMVLTFMNVGVAGVPRTIGLLVPIIFLFLLSTSRAVIRMLVLDVLQSRAGRSNLRVVAIYGAGLAGQQLAVSLRHEPNVEVAAFIDDDRRLLGQRLDGIQVHSPDRLEDLVEQMGIQEVLLALPSATRARRKAIIDALQHCRVKVQSLPSLAHILDGQIDIHDLREVPIEDLLGRDPVRPNELLLARNIAGKRVLLTGAGGSIGSELCRQVLQSRPSRLVLVESSEYSLYAIEKELSAAASEAGIEVEIIPELANVIERDSMSRIFRRWQPETVFHAAAYKHVPLVETNPIAGVRNNVFGTLSACLAAEETGVGHFILVSTDKAVRPTNVMGASKRLCELVVQARAAVISQQAADRAKPPRPIFAMVRFGNVLGSSGSVVPLFKQQIRDGGPLTLTHRDVTRYFMTIPEAAQLVIQAGALAKGGDVFVLDMGEPVKVIDLARSLIRLSGHTVKEDGYPQGDIEIREVGLRLGEKLYEELLIGDNPEPTTHDRIMRAQEAMIGWSELTPELDRMAEFLREGDAARALALLSKLVPEFQRRGPELETVGAA